MGASIELQHDMSTAYNNHYGAVRTAIIMVWWERAFYKPKALAEEAKTRPTESLILHFITNDRKDKTL